MDITAHDIAISAYRNGLINDYEAVPGETSYRLFHLTNNELSIVFDIDHDKEGNIDGWSYAQYERDEYREWRLIGQGGYGLNPDEDIVAVITKKLSALVY